MATYIIGYDIHPSRGECYDEFFDAIKELGTCWKGLASTWVVVSPLEAVEIRDKLQRHCQDKDQLLVVNSGGGGAWVGFDKIGNRWLTDNL